MTNAQLSSHIMQILCLLLLFVTLCTAGQPSNKVSIDEHFRRNAASFMPSDSNESGDFELRELDIRERRPSSSKRRRRSFNQNSKLWPGGVLYYSFNETHYFSDAFKKNFETVKNDFAALTCLKLVERQSDMNYVLIGNHISCWSDLGMQGGKQHMSLGSTCKEKDIIAHELMHAFGFNHEQSRPDRDKYITVHYENMNNASRKQFDIIQPSTWDDLESKYDYESIMHYGKTFFSNNGGDTMVTKDPQYQDKIGRYVTFSANDIHQLNTAYECRRDLNKEYYLEKSTGDIKSPNFPNSYNYSTVREWAVTVPSDGIIRFDSIHFDIEPSPTCAYDYLEIFDGYSAIGKSITGKLCGAVVVKNVRTSGNKALVRFYSDQLWVYSGFHLKFITVTGVQTINSYFGNIRSPNYPLHYPKDLDREWRITAKETSRNTQYRDGLIIFRVYYFDVESSTSCEKDYLEIYDGHTTSQASITGKLCGNQKVQMFVTTGNTALVKFHSNGQSERRGFDLRFDTEFYWEQCPVPMAMIESNSYTMLGGDCPGNGIRINSTMTSFSSCKKLCDKSSECRGFSHGLDSDIAKHKRHCVTKKNTCVNPQPVSPMTFFEKQKAGFARQFQELPQRAICPGNTLHSTAIRTNADGCARCCRDNPECQGFSVWENWKLCYLKSRCEPSFKVPNNTPIRFYKKTN